MNNIKSFLSIILIFFSFILLISCEGKNYTLLMIKNKTNKDLHISMDNGKNTSAIIYCGHTSCLTEKSAFVHIMGPYSIKSDVFENTMSFYDSCVVRINNSEGEIIKVWRKKEKDFNSFKNFFREENWRKEVNGDECIYTFVITEEDLKN
jgi:hypothetical protein